MGLKSIQSTGSLICVFVFAVILSYAGSPRFPLPGSLYLVFAIYLASYSLLLATNLRRKEKSGIPEPAAWLLHTRAYVFVLSASQVAVVGLLNILGFDFSGSRVSVVVGFMLAGVFIIVSYMLVAIADSPKQEGGSSPLSFFGRPRSRRLVFFALMYSPIVPLMIMSFIWSDWKSCPTLLRLPQFWFLLTSLIAALSAGMIFQRYRRVEANKKRAARILVVMFLVFGFTGLVDWLLGYRLYMYALSSIALACIAATAYWISLARGDAAAR